MPTDQVIQVNKLADLQSSASCPRYAALLMAGVAAVWLAAGCAGNKPPAPVQDPAPTPSQQPVSVLPPPPPPSPPPCSSPVPTVPRLADLLDQGQEDKARTELKCLLAEDPGSANAQLLLRHIESDVADLFGKDFRPYPYTLRPNETLSMVAQRVYGNPLHFYALARYNGIKVPRQVSAGQTIRVPSRKPLPPPPPSPQDPRYRPDQRVEPKQDTKVDPKSEPKSAPGPEVRPGPSYAEIAASKHRAYGLYHEQNLKGSLQAWERVLELAPADKEALRESARIRKLICKADPGYCP